jgi:photosystem II stability/assembly factor-like uncharacterized protein
VSWRAGATAPGDLRGVSISADGSRILAVGTGGLVWRSGDGGESFARVATGAGEDIAAIGFDDGELGNQGWAVGAAGLILHTSDDGRTFGRLTPPIAVDFTAVEDL